MTLPLYPLKPCPFCDSKDVVLTEGQFQRMFYVFCNNCRAAGPDDLGNSGACEAWNTRPVEAQLLEAVKELEWGTESICKVCRGTAEDHQPGCWIAAAIAAAEVTP